jgi:hypothetical protein
MEELIPRIEQAFGYDEPVDWSEPMDLLYMIADIVLLVEPRGTEVLGAVLAAAR